MSINMRNISMFAVMALLFVIVGQIQSWSLSLAILNLCLISSIMALGVNIQWGYGGLLNVGVMGFAALGGLAGILVAAPPVPEAWAAGGQLILAAALCLAVTVAAIFFIYFRFKGSTRVWLITLVGIVGYFAARSFYSPGVAAIEAVDPAATGFLGGLGFPIILSWIVGGLFAAGAAWLVGKIALGLRSDYLAIATLGISEIIIAMLKFEDWLTRGVKNVIGLPRPWPVPYEVDIQKSSYFQELRFGKRTSICTKLAVSFVFSTLPIEE